MAFPLIAMRLWPDAARIAEFERTDALCEKVAHADLRPLIIRALALRVRTDDNAAMCLWNALQEFSAYRTDVVWMLGTEEYAENPLVIRILSALVRGEPDAGTRTRAIFSLGAILSPDVGDATRSLALLALEDARRDHSDQAVMGIADLTYNQLVVRGVFTPAFVKQVEAEVVAATAPNAFDVIWQHINEAVKQVKAKPPAPAPKQPKLEDFLATLQPPRKVPADPMGNQPPKDRGKMPSWKIAALLLGAATLATGVVVAYRFWAKPPQIEQRRYV